MSDINTEIAKYLDAQGLLNFDETAMSGDTFIELMPSSPDKAVAILTSQPNEGNPKQPYDYPGVQIIVRGGRDPRPVKERAQDIYDQLNGFTSDAFVSGGNFVISCFARQGGPIRIGTDQNDRFEFSINFDLIIRNETIHRK